MWGASGLIACVALLQAPGGLVAPAREAVRAYVAARERGDGDAEARCGARLEELARQAAGSPWSELLERALEWSDDDVSRYRAAASEIDEARRAPAAPDADELAALRAAAEGSGHDALLLGELGNLGHHLQELGRDAEARAWITWVSARAEHYDDLELFDWSLDWLAQNLWRRGELEGAAELLERAAGVAQRSNAPLERTRHLCDLSRVQSIRGDIDAALDWAARAEATAREAGSSAALRQAAEVRGGLLLELGQHARALELCLELAPREAHNLPLDDTQVRLDILASNALADVGRLESALFFARRAHESALSSAVQRSAPLLQLEAKLSLGLLLGDLGHWDEGLALLDAATAEFERLQDPRGLAWAAKNRGFVLFGARRFAEARAAFEQAEAGGHELALPELEGLAALGLAETLVFGASDATNLDQARVERELASATQCAERLAERQMQWRIAALRGHLLLERGQAEAARTELERAVRGIELWRRRLGAPGLVEHALRLRSDPYRDAAFAAARLGRTEEALQYAAQLQGRVLAELRARRDGGALPRSASELDTLRERIGRLDFQVRQAAESGARGPRDELDRAEVELDNALLASELAGRSALGAVERPLTLREVRGAMERSALDVALSFLVGEHDTLVLRVDAHETARHDVLLLLPVGRDQLAGLVRRLRDPIARLEAGELDLANLDFDVEAARRLHDLLVRPLELEPGARLALVTDDVLSALPFEWLVCGGELAPFDAAHAFAQFSGLAFLGDDHALAYYGSLADLDRPRAPLGVGGVTVFVAPESIGVPDGLREAEAIRRAVGGRPVRIVADARAADVRERSAGAAVLHFIAHGRVDPEAPAHGCLLLGSGNDAGRPERLEAWEIEELDLGGTLAVLSACHTAQGAWYSGAGLAGLTRGFLLAGASEVVASQWAVEDRTTARFMELFYAALERERSVPEALRVARVELRHATDPRALALAHPYFWAAWIVQR